MRHLAISYHTCPLEEPGTALAGGMNVYLRGLLPALPGETLVLTSGRSFEELSLGPVRIWRLPCRGPIWDREEASRQLPVFLEECRRRLEGSWDAVSAHYWMSGLAARELFPERRPVLMLHSLDPSRNPRRAACERRLAGECRLVFSSALDRAVSEARLGRLPDVRIIRPGVDPRFRPLPRAEARARLGLPEEGPLLGFVARADPSKNAPLARSETARLGLTLVETPGPRWPDGLPHAEMPWFYSAMDAMLSLSDYETFGLSVLEALASGCRVLVAPRGYWGGVARHTGLLRSSLAELPELLADPPPDSALVRRHFSWERAARRWTKALTE